MYPYTVFLGTDLYTLFLCAGILAAILVFRVLADRLKVAVALQNLALVTGVVAIALGYFSAVLFQAFYNIEKNGGELIIAKNTGATFYGGLIGGAAVFLLIYFVAGRFVFADWAHISNFYVIADIAMCSIAIAHALGRVGCLMAGCCHGKETDAWFGIKMLVDGRWQKVVPTQLFEAIFLLALFAWFAYRVLRKKGYCLELYMCIYGVWRFAMEYLRDDYRGTTVVSALTPSQFVAVLMVAGGVALIFLRKHLLRKKSQISETEN